jgi:MFS transporter, FSR family, fosmidomycin resistance protein
VFGWLLDHGQPNVVFVGAAAALALGIVSAGFVGLSTRRRGAPAAA